MTNKTFYLASGAEDKFIELFTEVFGIENTQYIAVQYPFVDIYGNNRYIDFALESEDIKIAIEVDGEIVHDKRKISDEKYYDELMRQNSLIYGNWKLYRWTDKQLVKTPDRVKDELTLTYFQISTNTAVERDVLVSVRCIRIKTNIDLTNVRFNGIKYNFLDLENKMYIPERNNLIVDTYVDYVKDKKTVIFCVSVKHGEEIANLLREKSISAESVSGSTNSKKRKEVLNNYENGNINVLCACDLLNEGWDSPKTEVLFMARPTMSKTIYMQQLGRGMRKTEGKEYLTVFDFVDNANMFNEALSMHRMFNEKEYRPGSFVLAPKDKKKFELDLWRKGERPDLYLDIPIYEADYEEVNIFNWRDEIKNMISQKEFVRMVSVQSETISRYINDGKVSPDRVIETGYKNFNFFYKDTVGKYAKKFKWDIITPANMMEKFMEMVEKMDMSYSYKPVLLYAMLENVDDKGRVLVEDLIDYFIYFYENRRKKGLVVEKKKCIYLRGDYSRNEVMRNIFSNPFKRFEDMGFMKRSKDLEYVEFNKNIWNKLTNEKIKLIIRYCDSALKQYYDEQVID